MLLQAFWQPLAFQRHRAFCKKPVHANNYLWSYRNTFLLHIIKKVSTEKVVFHVFP